MSGPVTEDLPDVLLAHLPSRPEALSEIRGHDKAPNSCPKQLPKRDDAASESFPQDSAMEGLQVMIQAKADARDRHALLEKVVRRRGRDISRAAGRAVGVREGRGFGPVPLAPFFLNGILS